MIRPIRYRTRTLSFYGLAILLMTHVSCGSGSQSRSATEPVDSSVTAQPPLSTDSLCFQQTMNRDTTTLQLVLAANRASGQIDINPYEKDRARGTFTGTRTGNTINADWQRSGEGMTETYALTLTLLGDSISWGEGERIKRQGKWILKQSGGSYRYVLHRTPCH